VEHFIFSYKLFIIKQLKFAKKWNYSILTSGYHTNSQFFQKLGKNLEMQEIITYPLKASTVDKMH